MHASSFGRPIMLPMLEYGTHTSIYFALLQVVQFLIDIHVDPSYSQSELMELDRDAAKNCQYAPHQKISIPKHSRHTHIYTYRQKMKCKTELVALC